MHRRSNAAVIVPVTTKPACRAIIVGAGLMGRWHGEAAARAGADIAVVVDLDDRRAHGLARRFGATTAPSLESVPPAGDPTVVHLCTPTASHVALTRLALDRGAHVLVEKPLAEDPADAQALLALAHQRQRLLCPVHQYPFQRGVAQVRARAAALGVLRHLDMVMCSAGADGQDDEAPDRVAFEILAHPLSIAEALVPDSAGPLQWSGFTTGPGEWRVLGLGAGVSFSLLISMSGRPTTNTLTIVGDKGTAHLDLFHGFATIEGGAVSRARKIVKPFARAAALGVGAAGNLAGRVRRREPAYPGLWELVAGFYGAVRSGSAAPVDPDEAVRIVRDAAVIRRAVAASGARP
jgi:predicted dehydrogenase